VPASLNDWFAKGDVKQHKVNRPGVRQGHETAPMTVAQGKKKRLMSPAACMNFHPFTKTLRKWEEGVLVDYGDNWTHE
jgi:hypothetical protein